MAALDGQGSDTSNCLSMPEPRASLQRVVRVGRDGEMLSVATYQTAKAERRRRRMAKHERPAHTQQQRRQTRSVESARGKFWWRSVERWDVRLIEMDDLQLADENLEAKQIFAPQLRSRSSRPFLWPPFGQNGQN
jgi:hypothetical protein